LACVSVVDQEVIVAVDLAPADEPRTLLPLPILLPAKKMLDNSKTEGRKSPLRRTKEARKDCAPVGLLQSRRVTMVHTPSFMLQALESRICLSAPTATPNPTIAADRAQLKTDEQKLYADARTGETTIRADRKAISDELAKLRASDPNLSTELKPLYDKLAADAKAGAATIKADYQAIENAGKADRALIEADYKQLWIDTRAKDTAKIAADKAKLTTDKAKLDADTKPARDKLKADQTALANLLKADRDAVTAKLESLDPALKPLYAKLASDQSALSAKLKADEAKVKADHDKLVADLKALKTTV
jgi:hypothetical protein